MDDKQKAALVDINIKLGEIKEMIRKNWGPKISPDNPEVVLFIEDKKNSPSRKQVEDIEGGVNDMKMMSR